jgi:type IV secretion system protein TrbF
MPLFAKLGKQQIAIDVSSAIRASPSSFGSNGSSTATRTARSPRPRARRNLALDRDPHRRDPAANLRRRARKNPLGIYVTAINWSKELGQ